MDANDINALVDEFPFLAYTDMEGNRCNPDSYGTFMDDVNEGWKSIALDTFKKIRDRLVEIGKLDSYRLLQIKEKFGYGRIYDNMVDPVISEAIGEYERNTARTCIRCGNPANWKSCGWISPYCDECKKVLSDDGINFEPNEDYDGN